MFVKKVEWGISVMPVFFPKLSFETNNNLILNLSTASTKKRFFTSDHCNFLKTGP